MHYLSWKYMIPLQPMVLGSEPEPNRRNTRFQRKPHARAINSNGVVKRFFNFDLRLAMAAATSCSLACSVGSVRAALRTGLTNTVARLDSSSDGRWLRYRTRDCKELRKSLGRLDPFGRCQQRLLASSNRVAVAHPRI